MNIDRGSNDRNESINASSRVDRGSFGVSDRMEGAEAGASGNFPPQQKKVESICSPLQQTLASSSPPDVGGNEQKLAFGCKNSSLSPSPQGESKDLLTTIAEIAAVAEPRKKVARQANGRPHVIKEEVAPSTQPSQEGASKASVDDVEIQDRVGSCVSGSLNDFDTPPSTYRISHEKCFLKYAQDHLLWLLDEREGRIPIQQNTTESYRLSHEEGHLSFASRLSVDLEDDDDETVSTGDLDDISSLGDDDNKSSLAQGEIFKSPYPPE